MHYGFTFKSKKEKTSVCILAKVCINVLIQTFTVVYLIPFLFYEKVIPKNAEYYTAVGVEYLSVLEDE